VGFGNPDVRIAPDRRPVLADREVETAVGLVDDLGVAVDPLDVVEAVCSGEPTGGGQLRLGVVDGVHRRAPAPHPRADVAGSAAEFDRPQAAQIVVEEAEFVVGDAPDAPGGLVGRPCPLARLHPLRRHLVPVPPVLGDVIGQPSGVHRPQCSEKPEPEARAFVELKGIEPLTSSLRTTRSTN
jgi:hypothetical protein